MLSLPPAALNPPHVPRATHAWQSDFTLLTWEYYANCYADAAGNRFRLGGTRCMVHADAGCCSTRTPEARLIGDRTAVGNAREFHDSL